ncbi:Ankyrin repeat and SAM domain-containing protein 1A [Durusdinium trenchii]|uniref:Ankyrin repeat and SAM domain-containing protein 1A n=1 Tax=Durusdinium trenchii TaxID=1381693 RepID=A0ABP0HR58_9DINO
MAGGRSEHVSDRARAGFAALCGGGGPAWQQECGGPLRARPGVHQPTASLQGPPRSELRTQDPEELALLQRWCGYQGLRLHVTENERSGIDRFSTRFWSNHVNMTEEGRVAALNLVIGSRGVAVIGSLHSAWMKLQPAFMMAHQRKVVLVVGLASQDYQNFGSLSGSDAGAQQLLRPGEVFQAVPWLQNVARHPIS